MNSPEAGGTTTILLYYPPVATEDSDILFNFPLPVLSICSLLDTNRYDIRIESGLAPSWEKLTERASSAICLGISIMTGGQIKNAISLVKRIRLANPGLPIVFGWYHATALPEQTLQSPYADIVVR